MAKKPTIDDEVVGAQVLARRLNLTVTSMSRLAAQGVLVKRGRGKYLAWASVRSLIEHRDRASALKASPASVARAALLRIQAQRAALAYKREQAQLVDIDDVTDRISALFKICRAGMLALPARLAARCALTREAALAADDEVRAILTELGSTKAATIVKELAAVEAEKRGKHDRTIRAH